MRPSGVLAAAVLAVCSCATAPAWAKPIRVAEPMRGAETQAYTHYVEFRVALNGTYGHSYIAYGRLNALGQPATAAYADIHPTGDFPSMVLNSGGCDDHAGKGHPRPRDCEPLCAAAHRRAVPETERHRRPRPRRQPHLEHSRVQLQRLRRGRGARHRHADTGHAGAALRLHPDA